MPATAARTATHGRDALARAGQLQKVGGGEAGFDFTKLDANGNALPASATSWDCVRDNVTGLIWEVKTTSGLRSWSNTYTWYDPNSPDGNPGDGERRQLHRQRLRHPRLRAGGQPAGPVRSQRLAYADAAGVAGNC